MRSGGMSLCLGFGYIYIYIYMYVDYGVLETRN